MTRLLAIARNAFVETIRQPIFGVLILLTFLVLVLDVPLSSWTMGRGQAEYRSTDQQMLLSLGLSQLLISGLWISAFSAAGVLSREIEDRTVLTVVSKPVPRAVLVLGKYVGVAAALIAAYYLCSLAFLMTVRHGVMPTASDKPCSRATSQTPLWKVSVIEPIVLLSEMLSVAATMPASVTRQAFLRMSISAGLLTLRNSYISDVLSTNATSGLARFKTA